MGEVPDLGFFADLDFIIHDSSWVNEDIRKVFAQTFVFLDSRLRGNDRVGRVVRQAHHDISVFFLFYGLLALF